MEVLGVDEVFGVDVVDVFGVVEDFVTVVFGADV